MRTPYSNSGSHTRRKTGPSSSGRGQEGKSCSCVMLISWSLILGWLVFLFYAWRSGHLHATSRLPASYISRVNSMIDGIDHSLRGGGVGGAAIKGNPIVESVPEIPHTHVEAPVTPTAVVNVPVPPQVITQTVATEGGGSVSVIGSEKSDIHVIFSTDCTSYQDWQTILLFHSAMVVGQKGPVTRIASGCDDKKKQELTALYKKLFPQYHVHFTPDFKKDEKTQRSCEYTSLCLHSLTQQLLSAGCSVCHVQYSTVLYCLLSTG